MENSKEDSGVIETKERNLISKNLQVDSEIWVLLVHSYLKSIFENTQKDKNVKNLALENLASDLGRNIVEKCVDDRLSRYKTRLDIIKFIGVDVWTFLFGKAVTKIDSRDEVRETYYFHDNDFKFFRRISTESETGKEYVQFCMTFISYLLRSALLAFSIESDINIESTNYTEYTFIISIKPA